MCWCIFATIWTCIAAYWIPPYKEKTDVDQGGKFSLTDQDAAMQNVPPMPPMPDMQMDQNFGVRSNEPVAVASSSSQDQVRQLQSMIQNYGQQQQQQQQLAMMMPFNGFRQSALSVGSSVSPQQHQQQQYVSSRPSATAGATFSVTSNSSGTGKPAGKVQLRVPDNVR
jgi:TolA-binding protein